MQAASHLHLSGFKAASGPSEACRPSRCYRKPLQQVHQPRLPPRRQAAVVAAAQQSGSSDPYTSPLGGRRDQAGQHADFNKDPTQRPLGGRWGDDYSRDRRGGAGGMSPYDNPLGGRLKYSNDDDEDDQDGGRSDVDTRVQSRNIRWAAAAMAAMLLISGVAAAMNLREAWISAMSFVDSYEYMIVKGPMGLPLPRAWLLSLVATSAALLCQGFVAAMYAAIARGRFPFTPPVDDRTGHPLRPAHVESFLQLALLSMQGIFYSLIGLWGMLSTMLATMQNPAVLGVAALHSAFTRLYLYGIGAMLCTALAQVSSAMLCGIALQAWGAVPQRGRA